MWVALAHGHIDLLHASIAATGACESALAGTCRLCTWAAAGGTGGTCGTGVGACAVPCTVNTVGGRAVGTSGIDDTGTEAAGSVCAAVGISGTDTGTEAARSACGAGGTSGTDTCTEAAGSASGTEAAGSAGGTSGTDTCTEAAGSACGVGGISGSDTGMKAAGSASGTEAAGSADGTAVSTCGTAGTSGTGNAAGTVSTSEAAGSATLAQRAEGRLGAPRTLKLARKPQQGVVGGTLGISGTVVGTWHDPAGTAGVTVGTCDTEDCGTEAAGTASGTVGT